MLPSDSVSAALGELRKFAEEIGVDPEWLSSMDDEDLTVFALRYTKSEAGHAFNSHLPENEEDTDIEDTDIEDTDTVSVADIMRDEYRRDTLREALEAASDEEDCAKAARAWKEVALGYKEAAQTWHELYDQSIANGGKKDKRHATLKSTVYVPRERVREVEQKLGAAGYYYQVAFELGRRFSWRPGYVKLHLIVGGDSEEVAKFAEKYSEIISPAK